MSLNSQVLQPNESTRRIKHLHLQASGAAEVEYVPRLYFEAKIDFVDVRSGLRHTCGVSNAMEVWDVDGDALWTKDMVWPVDAGNLRTGVPDGCRLKPLPECVNAAFLSRCETQFFQYLLRYFGIKVYRSFAANIYSSPGESHGDFSSRCQDLMGEPFRRDMDELYEIYQRKFAQIKEKHWPEPESDTVLGGSEHTSYIHNLMHEASERLAGLFLRTEFMQDASWQGEERRDTGGYELVEQKLISLEVEAKHAIEALMSSYREKVRNIDEYVVHPSLRDIHLVRSCILWMPLEGSRGSVP